MTNNQKIILGVGAIALAYWLYTKKGSGASSQTPSDPNPCKNPNEVPCNNGSGKCYNITAKYSKDPCQLTSTNDADLRKICEKQINDAFNSGMPMIGIPKENQIANCITNRKNYQVALKDGESCDLVVGGVVGILRNGGVVKNGVCVKKSNDANFSNFTSKSTRQSCARMYCVKDCIDTPRGGRCTI